MPIDANVSMPTLTDVTTLRESVYAILDGEVAMHLDYSLSKFLFLSKKVRNEFFTSHFLFLGVKCDSICDRGRYGPNCQKRCDCEANGSSCDQQFGMRYKMYYKF